MLIEMNPIDLLFWPLHVSYSLYGHGRRETHEHPRHATCLTMVESQVGEWNEGTEICSNATQGNAMPRSSVVGETNQRRTLGRAKSPKSLIELDGLPPSAHDLDPKSAFTLR